MKREINKSKGQVVAGDFTLKGTYWKSNYVIPYENADGKEDEFYEIIQQEYEKIALPNSSFSFITFRNRKKGDRKLCRITSDVAKTYTIWYSASIVGNLLVLSIFEAGSLWVNPLAGTDYKTAIDWIGRYLFYESIGKMDPNYKENISLLELKKTKFA